jgi:hypothetical protein
MDYHILKRTSVWGTLFNGSYVALLREDSVQRTVHIYRSPATGDELLYAFPLELGPYPATYRYPDWLGDIEVVAIDTVLLADGPHRRLTLNTEDIIIEGVGSVYSFMPSTQSGEIHWLARLVCHTVDGMVVFSGYYVNCECEFTVGVKPASPTQLSIHPSPTTELCHLTGAPANTGFVIRSTDGRTAHAGVSSFDGTALIDMSHLPKALYFLEILDKRMPAVVKIVKQ